MSGLTKKELLNKVEALGDVTDAQRNSIICSLIGHSNIETTFFGYHYCGRCEAQVGDTLGSVYQNDNVVVVGHDCDICRANYKRLTWRDKLYAPEHPLKSEKL